MANELCPWTTGEGQSLTVCGKPATYHCDHATSDLCVQHKSSCCVLKDGAPAPAPDPDHVDGWVWGTGLDDAESCTEGDGEVYPTREEAAAAGNEDCGWRARDEGFQTAWKRWGKTEMPNQLDAVRSCEDAENEEFGEAMLEHWTDAAFSDVKHPTIGKTPMDDLESRLEALWEQWSTDHNLATWGYWFDKVEHHAFTPTAEETAEAGGGLTNVAPDREPAP